jgi:hypothetical protein
VRCHITDACPVQVGGTGLRLTQQFDPAVCNYRHLQVPFDDGWRCWYEAGWVAMVSEPALFARDIISPNRCVSVVTDQSARSDDIDIHTKTALIRVCRAASDERGNFVWPGEHRQIAGEPGPQGLCERVRAVVLKAIREDIDLTRHMAEAVQSLRICLAADENRADRPRDRSLIGTCSWAR